MLWSFAVAGLLAATSNHAASASQGGTKVKRVAPSVAAVNTAASSSATTKRGSRSVSASGAKAALLSKTPTQRKKGVATKSTPSQSVAAEIAAQSTAPRALSIVSWDAETTVHTEQVLLVRVPGGDPYKITMSGFSADEDAVFEAQGPSRDLGVVPNYGQTDSRIFHSILEDALAFVPFNKLAIKDADTVEGADKTSLTTHTIPDRLAVHTPVRAVAYKGTERVARSAVANVQGKPDKVRRTESLQGSTLHITTYREGGTVQAHYQPWLNANNVFVTPPFAEGPKAGQAHFAGLAAFPMGATVRITNLSTSETIEGLATDTTGSVEGYLANVKPGMRFKLVVEFPAQDRAAHRTVKSLLFTIPSVGTRGLDYYPIQAEQAL